MKKEEKDWTEYLYQDDIHIGLTYGKEIRKSKNGSRESAVSFPKSAVLYLGDEQNVPLYENCTMYFQDVKKY